MSLIARHLEAHGLPTVILGCARDIVEHAGVPRFVWSDFPLGNSAGKPHDPESQRQVLTLALDAFATAEPRTTIVSPAPWAAGDDWKRDYLDTNRLTAEELERRRAEHVAQRRVAHRLPRD